jgi:hypothetical protein
MGRGTEWILHWSTSGFDGGGPMFLRIFAFFVANLANLQV